MAVQLALAVVTREPRLDEGGAALGVARFVITVRPGMRGKGVVRVSANARSTSCAPVATSPVSMRAQPR